MSKFLDDEGLKYYETTVKARLQNKQDTLVSGTNIKTINSTSLLGSGDISIPTGASNLENGTGTGSLKTTGAYSANGNYSFAEGNLSIASGDYSHAEGSGSQALGNGSHTEGMGTVASGFCSHAEGGGTTASSDYQHVEGFYNIADSNDTYIHIAGNGDNNNNRSNAYTLDWSGNGVYAGKVTVGSDPTNAMDVATKQYVDKASNYIVAGMKNPMNSIAAGTLTKLNLDKTINSNGNLLTLDATNHEIVIGSGVNNVEIAAQMYIYEINGNGSRNLYIYKNNTSIVRCLHYYSANYQTMQSATIAIPVTAGDKISLRINSQGGTAKISENETGTKLYVKVID